MAEYAKISNGMLMLVDPGRVTYKIGINQARKYLAQIEASKLDLKPSTIARRDALRKGIELWEAHT